MTREKEFKNIKELIQLFYNQARCGLYDTRNIVGDTMINIYTGDFFQLDICLNYSYFEVFGTTADEFAKLEKLYQKLGEEND